MGRSGETNPSRGFWRISRACGSLGCGWWTSCWKTSNCWTRCMKPKGNATRRAAAPRHPLLLRQFHHSLV